MKKILYTKILMPILVLSALVLGGEVKGQTLYDSYTDGDFTANPVWGGSTTAWTIVANSDAAAGATGSNTLRLNASAVATTDYLSSQISTWGVSQEWGFFFGRRAQALTAANQAYFWLYANESNLTSATVDGYRIAIGDDAGNDDIRLEYIVNGAVSATVIASAGAITNTITDFGVLIRVTRSSTGGWEVFTSTIPTTTGSGAIATAIPNATNASISQGTATNNSLVPAANGYVGVAALHSTGANAIISTEFDQVYFTQSSGGTTATLANITQPSGSITQGTSNAVLAGFSITPSASINFTDITLSGTGTATSTDITNVRIYRDNDGNGAINGADAAVSGPAAQSYGATMSFAGITSETGLSSQAFYLVVADIAGVGVSTPGRTSTVGSNTFVTTATTNTGSFSGNSRTIVAPPGTTTITAGAGTEPLTISSLVNTLGAASLNFDFTITDDGATPATDGAASQISQLVLNTGTGNTITNWANAILGVELSDGTNSTTTATIGASSITFASLPNAVGNLGYIADDAAKTYTLKIWLKPSLGALATTIDGLNFVFRIQTADVTVSGSQIAAAQDVNSGASNNVVDVTATALAFVQQPAASVAINTAMTPAITVSANDANGNRDLGFTSSVDITSTGTLTGSPVSSAAVAGLASFATLTHTANGTGLTLNAERTGTLDWDVQSTLFDVVTPSNPSDYFRSNVATGTWATPASWESSSDNITWQTATIVPTSLANTITIRSGHNITISANASCDQLVIANGGILTYSGGVLSVNDDASGDDIIIQNGGMLVYAFASTTPTFGTGATLGVNTGGVLRIQASGITGNGANVNNPNHIYYDGAILDWNLASATPSASGVTYFPNVNATTVPILRFSSATAGALGGTNPTVVNGKLEVTSGVTISFQSSGTKTFRNGIIGAGNVTQGSAGQFIINGNVNEIGGSGTLTLGAAGLSVAGGVTTLSSSKSIQTGTISVSGTLVTGTFQLSGSSPVSVTATGTLKVGSTNASDAVTGNIPTGAVTLASGSTVEFNGAAAQFAAARTFSNLTINNANGLTLTGAVGVTGVLNFANGIINTSSSNLLTLDVNGSFTGAGAGKYVSGPLARNTNAVTAYVFPVGKGGTYRPATVNATTTNANTFTAEYFNADPNVAVGSTLVSPVSGISGSEYWDIAHTTGTDAATITLTVNGAIPGGTTADYLLIAHYNSVTPGWEDAGGGNALLGDATSGTLTSNALTSFSPFTIGKRPSVPLPVIVEYFRGAKQGIGHLLSWKVNCINTPSATLILERSSNGRDYVAVNSITATAFQCQQPFSYLDNAPLSGINYYRLKMIDADGKLNYSSIVALTGAKKGFELINIAPNPVIDGKFKLNITSAELVKMQVNILDLGGRVVLKQDVTIANGFNSIDMNVSNLAAGTYQLFGITADGRTKVLQFVKQ